jgi:sugar transferase EpsL
MAAVTLDPGAREVGPTPDRTAHEHAAGAPGVATDPRRRRPADSAVKRATDVVLSAMALIVLAPVVVAVGLAIRKTMGPPILFRQLRPGRLGRPFVITKFRTMAEARDPDGRPLPDEVRITRLGRFLRRVSLDELPELWNVLKGDMSLVGPRPLLMEYLERYTREEARRHETRPGITGWAQVHGRRQVRMHQRFALDVWYVDNWSLGLDMRILAMTIRKVVRGEGVEPGAGTVDPFEILPAPDGVRARDTAR